MGAFFGSGDGVGIPAKSHYNTPCVCPLSPIWGKAIRPHTLAPLRPWTCWACEMGGGMYTRARPLAIQYRTSQRRREKRYGSICINTRCTNMQIICVHPRKTLHSDVYSALLMYNYLFLAYTFRKTLVLRIVCAICSNPPDHQKNVSLAALRPL